jgi:hypothetical protein
LKERALAEKKPSYSVMVARFPGNNQEHPDSSGYVIGLMETLLNDDRVSRILPFRISDTPITMCRNKCVKDALAQGADYVLMIDSDMKPDVMPGAPPFWDTAWNFMMDRRESEIREHAEAEAKYGIPARFARFAPATIAAPYCGPPPNECVYVFRWANRASGDPNPDFSPQMFDRDDAARKTGIEEVAALPTGLILYDARVFKKLPKPWYRYEWKDEEESVKASTEDVYQTRNASLMGMPQYCAWDCWAGHIKLKTVVKPEPLTIGGIRQEWADAIVRFRSKPKDA